MVKERRAAGLVGGRRAHPRACFSAFLAFFSAFGVRDRLLNRTARAAQSERRGCNAKSERWGSRLLIRAFFAFFLIFLAFFFSFFFFFPFFPFLPLLLPQAG